MMDFKNKELKENDTNNFEHNLNKSQICDLPKLTISFSESRNSTRYDSNPRKIPKKVTFKRLVTVVNIESHKKYLKKQNYQALLSSFEDEDFNDDNKNCTNCNIF